MTPNRVGITLIECVAAIALLAAALPPTLTLVQDASESRLETMQIERATWYATALLEHISADVASEAAGLGFDALANANTYLNTASTGLFDRTQTLDTLYAPLNLSANVSISGLVSANGTSTGNVALDVYRTVTTTISWPRRGGTGSLSLSRLVSDL
jgi:hypothetical protein